MTLVSGFNAFCSVGSATTAGTTVTITLADNGGSCSLPKKKATTVQIDGVTNPAAGTYTGTTFSVATTADSTPASPGNVVISAATQTGAPTFTGVPQTGSARSTWTVGFTASASGALAAGDTITTVFPAGFTIPATPTVTLTGAYSNCTATATAAGTTVTITLADNAGTCALANSASGALKLAFLTNPAAGAIAAANWSVKTSVDTSARNPAAAITIAAATQTGAPTFTGVPQTGSARSTWTVGFTASASGALAAGDTITTVFPAGFTIPATPTVTLTGAYSNCTATATAAGTTVTITLADNAGTCALANSASGALKLAFLTNPAAGAIAAANWSVKTSVDTSARNPAAAITIAAATSPTPVTFSASTRAAGASATWTVAFTASASGALAAGDTITTVFPAGFTIPATPTITLPSGFTNCSAAATSAGTTSRSPSPTAGAAVHSPTAPPPH